MAFLKRMKVRGFKSFAYPTTIDFTDGLTVVVGPNGSGKSNINDALKWVLGEASKKTLRASTADDMIFSGTDKEKPADFAEVKLIFDNSEKILNINLSEVSVTRKSFRNGGTNKYFINDELVRLKDVKDLFLDTGLGNTDLSIISQGSVAKITGAKPDEIKTILNEAAGVARYQKQKDQAVKKLDKVEHDLDVFEVKLSEMNKQVGPLKKAAEKAIKYKEIKDQLSEIELPLIKEQLSTGIKRKEELEKILTDSSIKTQASEGSLEKIRAKKNELEDKIIELDKELFALQTKQNEMSKQVNVNEENDDKQLENAIKSTLTSINSLRGLLNETIEQQKEVDLTITRLREEQYNLRDAKESVSNKLSKAEYELSNMQGKTTSSRNRGSQIILENRDIFNTVYGQLSDLISYKDEYDMAVQVALGAKLNNIIVNNERTISEAVHFLKENKYGKATFVPAESVKPQFIQDEYLAAISNLHGYIGTLESVIKTKAEFRKVVASVAGRVLLFEDIDKAMVAAKQTGYKYTIVTLDGDIVYPGMTVRGGYNKSAFGSKKAMADAVKLLKEEYTRRTEQLANSAEKINDLQKKRQIHSTEIVRLNERLNIQEPQLERYLQQYKNSTGKDFDMGNQEFEGVVSLEEIGNKIRNIQTEKISTSEELSQLRRDEEEVNQIWKESIEAVSESKVEYSEVTKEVDHNMKILNSEYKMTWEALEAAVLDKLTMSFAKAAEKRKTLRAKIKEIGYVDLESIERYESIKDEYESLKSNVEDLRDSKEKLFSTISEMDEIMKGKFSDTFDKINVKFQENFSILFRGGQASLQYTNPEDILESGVEILAKVPGKTIKGLSLYSGGEKALIALSLIFAINQVRNLPLLLLDEVEAALDEANVERFARFAKRLNETTQLIIVTHRPGTMEKADVLYGVTMQQKGITNIVSVRLEEAKELAQ